MTHRDDLLKSTEPLEQWERGELEDWERVLMEDVACFGETAEDAGRLSAIRARLGKSRETTDAG